MQVKDFVTHILKRAGLVDWMINLAKCYRFKHETIYHSVLYMYKSLSALPMESPRMKLLGSTCLWIASKYEEVNPSKIEMFLQVNEMKTTKKEILQLEQRILLHLNFKKPNFL